MSKVPVFGLTIFTGAFLLFQVQPLIGKFILPWFGGGPGVWTCCLLFFQVLLLGGYGYAHFISRCFSARAQVLVHLTLVVVAIAMLPIIPSQSWKPNDADNPTLRIFALLAVNLGLPYFVLSATGPLLQHWLAWLHPDKSPYRLYALSNLGSLLALITFPMLFEVHFTRKAQAAFWGWGLLVYGVGCAGCAILLWRFHPPRQLESAASGNQPARPRPAHEPSNWQRALWVAFPACASMLLLATTNKICRDLAVIPFLWILPLALYLLSFIICFDHPRWYSRYLFGLGLIATLGCIYWALPQGLGIPLWLLLMIYCAGLFVCCMVCHGELYRLRPDPARLTSFYLLSAAGGALGGAIVAVAAPLVFTDYFELPCALVLCGVLLAIGLAREASLEAQRDWQRLSAILPPVGLAGLVWFIAGLTGSSDRLLKAGLIGVILLVVLALLVERARAFTATGKGPSGLTGMLVVTLVPWATSGIVGRPNFWRRLVCGWSSVCLVLLAIGFWGEARQSARQAVCRLRNFYGVLMVLEDAKDDPNRHCFGLAHSMTLHGLQLAAPAAAGWPTLYFGEQSGAGLGLAALSQNAGRRIALVGLGIGTLAAFTRPGDCLRCYEIDPHVVQLATSRFSYLSQCRGTIEYALGDARLSLERETCQHFDFIALDAFRGDAIPVHLLTKEAFAVYDRHLNTNGIIAVHISNTYLDLEPVLAQLANKLGYEIRVIESMPQPTQWWLKPAIWVLLSHSKAILDSPGIRLAARSPRTPSSEVRLWTDDFSSLFQVLRWAGGPPVLKAGGPG